VSLETRSVRVVGWYGAEGALLKVRWRSWISPHWECRSLSVSGGLLLKEQDFIRDAPGDTKRTIGAATGRDAQRTIAAVGTPHRLSAVPVGLYRGVTVVTEASNIYIIFKAISDPTDD
jgi:hypothetical protein